MPYQPSPSSVPLAQRCLWAASTAHTGSFTPQRTASSSNWTVVSRAGERSTGPTERPTARLSKLVDAHRRARCHGPGGPFGGSGREDVPGAVVLPQAVGARRNGVRERAAA